MRMLHGAVLEKLIVTQLVKKFTAFYVIWRFITVFTGSRHLSLSWARCIQSTPSLPISLRCILILSSHLLPGLPTKVLYVFFSSRPCYMPHPSHPSWFDHPNNIRWRIQVMKLLIMQSSPVSCPSSLAVADTVTYYLNGTTLNKIRCNKLR
jgi:hypothetical protein